MSSFPSSLDWLFAQQERGIHPGLGRMRALLAALGHPEEGLEIAQVGGTNGKGSTTRMLAEMLSAAGWGPVGEYTSPHLHRFAERIRVVGREIETAALEPGITRLREIHDEVPATFFELVTALALLHFREAGVRWAVLEVGLGGRLDATTAAPAVASAITTVGLDHTAILGNTVEEIAFEKAGILRPGAPAVTGASGPALEVIRARAREVGAELWALGEEITVEIEPRGLEGVGVAVDTPLGRLTGHTPMLGAHQGRNAALAVALGQRLGLPEGAILGGLAGARWPGRLELVEGDPPVLVDAAHNPEGAAALAAFVRGLGVPVSLVVAGLADKDLAGVAVHLGPLAESVVATRPRFTPRAAAPEEVARHYRGARTAEPVAEALDLARASAPPGGLVLVAGTIPLVAEALEALRGLPGEGRVRWQ